MKRTTLEDFLLKARTIHGDKYDYSKVVYTKVHSKVEIVCKIHGSFDMTPVAHTSQRQGCTKCANEYKSQSMTLTTDQFISKAQEVHNNIYDYSLVDYNDAQSDVTIICKLHGEFKQRPTNHIHNQAGCPKCADISGSDKRKTTRDKFIEKAIKTHSDRYDYSNIPRLFKMSDEIEMSCKEHGTFKRKPDDHIHSSIGCPTCSKLMTQSKGELAVSTILTKANIPFIREHRFNDCRGKRNPLRYDFYLPDHNLVIEYDGNQHHNYVPYLHRTYDSYLEGIRLDKIKDDYCKNNNIRMVRISNTKVFEIDQVISEILLEVKL